MKKSIKLLIVSALLTSWSSVNATTWDEVVTGISSGTGEVVLDSNVDADAPLIDYIDNAVINGGGYIINGGTNIIDDRGLAGATISIVDATISGAQGTAEGGAIINSADNTIKLGENTSFINNVLAAVTNSGSVDITGETNFSGNGTDIEQTATGITTIGAETVFGSGVKGEGTITNNSSATFQGDSSAYTGTYTQSSATGKTIIDGKFINGSDGTGINIIGGSVELTEQGTLSSSFNLGNDVNLKIEKETAAIDWTSGAITVNDGNAITKTGELTLGGNGSRTENILLGTGVGYDKLTLEDTITVSGSVNSDNGSIVINDGTILNITSSSEIRNAVDAAITNSGTLNINAAINFSGNGTDIEQTATGITTIGAETVFGSGVKGEGTITNNSSATFQGDSSAYTGIYTQSSATGKTIIDGTFFNGTIDINNGMLELTDNAVLSKSFDLVDNVELTVDKTAATVDWTTGSVSIDGETITRTTSGLNVEKVINLGGNGSRAESILLGTGAGYDKLTLEDTITVSGSVNSDNGSIVINDGTTLNITSASDIKNAADAAITNSGALNINAATNFSGSGTDIEQTATGITTIGAETVFGSGVKGEGTITNNSSATFQGDSSAYTGIYTQSSATGKTIIDGKFINGSDGTDINITGGSVELTEQGTLSSSFNLGNDVNLKIEKETAAIDWTSGAITVNDGNAITKTGELTLGGNGSRTENILLGTGVGYDKLTLEDTITVSGSVNSDNGSIVINDGTTLNITSASDIKNAADAAITNSGALNINAATNFSGNGVDLSQTATGTTTIGAETVFGSGVKGEGTIINNSSATFQGDSSAYTGTYVANDATTIIDGEFIKAVVTLDDGVLKIGDQAKLNSSININGLEKFIINTSALESGVQYEKGAFFDVIDGSVVETGTNAGITLASNVGNVDLIFDASTYEEANKILLGSSLETGEGYLFDSMRLQNGSNVKGVVESRDAQIEVENTSKITILSASKIENSTVDVDGELNFNASNENITIKDSGISVDGEMNIYGNKNTEFLTNTTITGSGNILKSDAGKVVFDANTDLSGFTGKYEQTDGATEIAGIFTNGINEISKGILNIKNTAQLPSDIEITTSDEVDVVVSSVISDIVNDAVNGSISINSSTGKINMGANQIDLTAIGAANSALNINEIGTNVNIKDLTLLNGAGINENVTTLEVNGSKLTFGANTSNHSNNNIVMDNATLNIGVPNESGNIDLKAKVSGTGVINKDYAHTLNIYSDNKDYTGTFTQLNGTTNLKAGATMFAGANTVKAGSLVLENDARLSENSINTITNTTANNYAILSLLNENQKDLTNIDLNTGVVTIKDYVDGYSTDVQIDKAGLYLANGYVQESNYESGLNIFQGASGIKELEFANGSGVLGNISIHDGAIVTYNDGTFVDDKGAVLLGNEVTLNLNYDDDTKFGSDIVALSSPAGALSNINKNGGGNVEFAKSIGTSAQLINTNLNINDGNVAVAKTVGIVGDINMADNTSLVVNEGITSGSIIGNNVEFKSNGALLSTGNVHLTGSDVILAGLQNNISGDLNIAESVFTSINDTNIGQDLNLNNTGVYLSNGDKATTMTVAGTTTVENVVNLSMVADGRDYTLGGIDTDVLHVNGAEATIELNNISFIATPRDYNFNIEPISANSKTGGDLKIEIADKLIDTPVGKYELLSGAGGSMQGGLKSINPQAYRGSVATVASYANQMALNSVVFDHMNIVSQQLIAEQKYANKYASIDTQFSPYQYDSEGGNLWYKSYVNLEKLSMTQGLNVNNNAYGSLIGADFPLITLDKGWKLIPTAYVAYNGAHQHFNGVSMYQNGGQLGVMGTAYKGDFITSLLTYAGGYYNSMNVAGNNDSTGNWYAGIASKSAYNLHLPADFIFQPTFMMAYNILGQQNWHSNYGIIGMNSGMLNGINIAPGFNIIWNKETFSLYATTQIVFNIMGDVDGKIGNIVLPDVGYRHAAYIEYGLGATKRIKERMNSYLQFTIRNGTRTGIGFQGGLQWKI